MSQVAIILAAGFSTRMGCCKAELPWLNGQTLLGYQIDQWHRVGCWPLVVLGTHNAHQRHLFGDVVRWVINSNPEAGKSHSIHLALAALPQPCSLIAISAVDQPRSARLYRQLIEAHRHHQYPITVPVSGNRSGHPVLFSGKLLPRLRQISEETQGLRQVMTELRSQVGTVQGPAGEIYADLNTPEAYREYFDQCRRENTLNSSL